MNSRHPHFYVAFGLAMALSCLSLAANAIDFADGKGQVHGFFTQGLVASTNNNFYGNSSDHVSLDFREIALNGSYRLTPGIQLSAQVISRRAGEIDNGELWVDYAFVDFTLFNNEDQKMGARLGRMKNPYGLLNDTRDAAFTRPGVVVPQPIYFDRTRRFSLSGDGIQLYGNTQAPGGTLDVTLELAEVPMNDKSSKAAIAGINAQGNLENDRLTKGARILYETDDGRWRGGLSYITINAKYYPIAGDTIPPVDFSVKPWIASLQYTNERWTLTGEYSQRGSKLAVGGVQIIDTISENWYVQGQYRFKPEWELLLRYDSAAVDRGDLSGKKFAARTGGATMSRYARDWVAGVRYDVTADFMVRAELHHIKGTQWLSALENPVQGQLERDWNMLMLLGSYHF